MPGGDGVHDGVLGEVRRPRHLQRGEDVFTNHGFERQPHDRGDDMPQDVEAGVAVRECVPRRDELRRAGHLRDDLREGVIAAPGIAEVVAHEPAVVRDEVAEGERRSVGL